MDQPGRLLRLGARQQVEIREFGDPRLHGALEGHTQLNAVQVWTRGLRPQPGEVARCRELLSREEHERADRYRVECPEMEATQLAERFFSTVERHALESLSGDDLNAAFFRCWTRKEAYAKARGDGLSLPLDQFDVSIEANAAQALLATRPDASEARRWTLCDLAVGREYAAALAVAEDEKRPI